MHQIKVMVVDDSAVMRQVMTDMLSQDAGLKVIGAASDPIFALEHMNKQWPDVIVLDVEMPRMDGISFLKKVMSERPTPIVICSTLTERGSETTLQALAAGAVNVVTKPKMGLKRFLETNSDDLVAQVKAAAVANVRRLVPVASSGKPGTVPVRSTAAAVATVAMAQTTEQIIAIGTSTGGTQALERVLAELPQVSPGIVVVQHMPEKFTASFAARLNSLCQIEVREAKDQDRVRPGLALIAPGGRHMMLKRSGAQYHVEVVDGPPVNRHRPSVDVLFRSVAKCAGKNSLGVIMTGMGDDGARGIKEMRDAGARTIAEDETTCVVFGMPKEAIRLGAIERVIPLPQIATEIIGYSEASGNK